MVFDFLNSKEHFKAALQCLCQMEANRIAYLVEGFSVMRNKFSTLYFLGLLNIWDVKLVTAFEFQA